MDLSDKIHSLLLISFGAILGSNLRLLIYNKLDNFFLKRTNLRILLINNLASFLLGLFFSISTQSTNINYVNNIYFLFSIGFLGSLSTFSTFIYDCFDISNKYKFLKSIEFIILSISLGLLSLWLGYLIGNV